MMKHEFEALAGYARLLRVRLHRHCGYAGGGSAPDMVRGGEQHERRDDDLPEQVGTVLA